MARKVKGESHTWQLSQEPIGSGDAGEVYAVACQDLPELAAVLKKPARIATGGTIQRQARQIAAEAKALALLDGLPRGKAHPPRLLDEAPNHTLGTSQYFIVTETAPGQDLAAMLAEHRQMGSPFPQRVIITVLDALFDLFSRAHKVGVLWNDVKLDHIFWENQRGKITIIDWGNAQFLKAESGPSSAPLARWQDYQQMLETLGTFLQQTAPDIYQDLGWGEFIQQDLDSPIISVLARRIAYQQEVIALKVMEYQSLIRVVLSADPSLDGLEKIQTYQKILEKIGAAWDQSEVLAYGQALVLDAVNSEDLSTCMKATAIMWALFPNSLNLSWHLMREYLRDPDLIKSEALPTLVRQTMAGAWSDSLWTLVCQARTSEFLPLWWDRLIPVLRQKALGLATPTPYQTVQTLLTWVKANPHPQINQSNLQKILDRWRSQGSDLQHNPFEYKILDWLKAHPQIPPRLRREIKNSFAAGKTGIRTVLQIWVNLSWDELEKAFRRLTGWDPDRWGIIAGYETTRQYQAWLDSLALGPTEGDTPASFLARMIQKRPPVEKYLGKPPWLKAQLAMLEGLQAGESPADFQAEIRTWCPWAEAHTSWTDPQGETPLPIDAYLNAFIPHLRGWHDIDGALNALRETAPPALYHICQSLAQAFDQTLNLTPKHDQRRFREKTHQHAALGEALAVLETLNTWREHLTSGDWQTAQQCLQHTPWKNWRILDLAAKATQDWANNILPELRLLANAPAQTCTEEHQDSPNDKLKNTREQLCRTFETWTQVYQAGLHRRLLETLYDEIDLARKAFLAWRHAQEKQADRIHALLYHSTLPTIRQISDSLMLLAQHIDQAHFYFTLFSQPDGNPPSKRLEYGEQTLIHLRMIETCLQSNPAAQKFPDWQAAYAALLDEPDLENRRALVLAMDHDHPLYAWLVPILAAFDRQP